MTSGEAEPRRCSALIESSVSRKDDEPQMARRRKTRSTGSSRKPWRAPRIRVVLRTLAAPFVLLARRLNAASLRRMSTGMSWVAAIAVLTLASYFGVPRLQAFASQERFAQHITVRFIDPPKWFNGDLSNHLMQTAEMHLAGDPLQRDDLIACREALLATGWFESIAQVRRAAPDLVEIEAQFCRPYAVVRDSDGDHLVDVVGRLLPLKYDHGARTKFIVISGSHFDRPQRCGEVWEGADVIAALRMLSVIDEQPWRAQVVEVDVTGFVDGGPMRLKTDKGTRIIWGGAPGEEPALEVLAEGKLKRLNFLYKTYGRIDAGEAEGELDITNERAVVAR